MKDFKRQFKTYQRKTNIVRYHLYAESKQIIQMSVYVKQKQTQRKQTSGYQREAGSGKLGIWDEEIQTATYETDKQQGYSI